MTVVGRVTYGVVKIDPPAGLLMLEGRLPIYLSPVKH